MKLTQDVIEDIRNSADIADIIGHYIPLVKKGKGYTAVCPFHDDHDPSLSISEDKQIYKCFVCGNGGNVFSFVSNFKKISFPESVSEVSKIIGKPIEIDSAPKRVSKFQIYYDVLNSMITYCSYLLNGSKLGEEAMNYLNGRGMDKELIEYFNIGFNPANNKIYDYLKNHNFTDEQMIKAGACRMLDKGMADIFYNRIVFPIHNPDGEPIGFTAREFNQKTGSKYINSAEGLIYTKGDNIYNYHRAKEPSRKAAYVIACEGVMDVIAFHGAGKDNVVATLGTACTRKQVELLSSLSKHVVLSYDGDAAGQAANIKIGTLLLEAGLQVSVIDNNTELDPDEIINQYGKNALRDLEAKKLTFIDYALKYYKNKFNLSNYNDRKQMTLLVGSLIDKITDEYDRDNYYNELFDLTKIRRRTSNDIKNIEYKDYGSKVSYTIDGLTKAEYTILVDIVMSKKALDIYQRQLGYLLDEANQKLAIMIIDDYRKNGKCSLPRLYDETGDENIKNLITTLAVSDYLPKEFKEEDLNCSIDKIKLEIKKSKLDNLTKMISKTLDGKERESYLREYENLIRELGGYDGKH